MRAALACFMVVGGLSGFPTVRASVATPPVPFSQDQRGALGALDAARVPLGDSAATNSDRSHDLPVRGVAQTFPAGSPTAGGVSASAKAGSAAKAPQTMLPDIADFTPDLAPPAMTDEQFGPGKRVRARLPNFTGDVYFALYLPVDWTPGGRFPVIVEYTGNRYRNNYGDVCTGRVEDSCLGYGMSGGRGAIWVCLPYVDTKEQRNAVQWWGDVAATVSFCKQAVRLVCADFGGDPNAVVLCGFSRGAIACNYIGLHDDEIAGLWRAFFAFSHYDGVRTWPYPDSDRASARARLERLRHRPVFIGHELHAVDARTDTVMETVNYLAQTGLPLDNFTFQQVPLRNHTDRWVLYDLEARRRLRAWYREVGRSGDKTPVAP